MIPKIVYQDELVTLFHGEFQQWEKSEPIDLIIADPPYPKEFKHLYDDLFAFSATSLWLGGSLVTIAPHYLLPYIFNVSNNSPKMKYRWMICMYQEQGAHPRMAMGIEVCWKPVLWYVRDSYRGGRGYVRDLFVNLPPPPKKLHKWQQAESWAEWIINKFSDSGEIIFDPMAGSGTSLVVARRLNRRAIGFEREQDAAMVAVKRLEDG